MESRVFEPDDSAPRIAVICPCTVPLNEWYSMPYKMGFPGTWRSRDVYDLHKILAPNAEKQQLFEQHLADVFRAEDCTDKLVLLDCISNQYSLLVQNIGGTELMLCLRRMTLLPRRAPSWRRFRSQAAASWSAGHYGTGYAASLCH